MTRRIATSLRCEMEEPEESPRPRHRRDIVPPPSPTRPPTQRGLAPHPLSRFGRPHRGRGWKWRGGAGQS
jgi:hypothetical protein